MKCALDASSLAWGLPIGISLATGCWMRSVFGLIQQAVLNWDWNWATTSTQYIAFRNISSDCSHPVSSPSSFEPCSCMWHELSLEEQQSLSCLSFKIKCKNWQLTLSSRCLQTFPSPPHMQSRERFGGGQPELTHNVPAKKREQRRLPSIASMDGKTRNLLSWHRTCRGNHKNIHRRGFSFLKAHPSARLWAERDYLEKHQVAL